MENNSIQTDSRPTTGVSHEQRLVMLLDDLTHGIDDLTHETERQNELLERLNENLERIEERDQGVTDERRRPE